MTSNDFVDHYEVLEVSHNANSATIERVFRYMAKRHHPDASKDGEASTFTKIVEAFDVLRDPQKRADYDVTYERQKHVNAKLVAGANAAGNDCVERYKLLSVFYAQRRRDFKKPGIGIGTLETLVPFPPDVLNFYLWYFREKGWIGREESGQISITAAGVDQIESMNVAAVSNQLLLGHHPERQPSKKLQSA